MYQKDHPLWQGWFYFEDTGMINKCKIINVISHVNGFKDKNYLVSVSAEKVFEKSNTVSR